MEIIRRFLWKERYSVAPMTSYPAKVQHTLSVIHLLTGNQRGRESGPLSSSLHGEIGIDCIYS